MAKIFILGQGNIGTMLGAALKASHHEVQHYVRPSSQARKEVRFHLTDRRKIHKLKKGDTYSYQTTRNLDDAALADFVIVSVAHYHLREAVQSLIPSLTSTQTMVIAGNIWDDFEWLDNTVPCTVVFAFPNFGGAIVDNILRGWLTPNFTTGLLHPTTTRHLDAFHEVLRSSGFNPNHKYDIKGWLNTHFAYNAGMLLEAAKQNGFQSMTRSFNSLGTMYKLMRECISTAKKMGVNTDVFEEGRKVNKPIFCNTFLTYFIFWVPGLAKQADATKDIGDWTSYAKVIFDKAQKQGWEMPLLSRYSDLLHG